MSRQDACKASSRRFISREQLSTDKEFIEIDNVSYTIASRLIFNISLEVFNQVWMRINAMDYDALITAYTDDVIIKYDEPEAEEPATVDMSELVVEEVPAPVEEPVEEGVEKESETEEVSADESAEESEEAQPEEEEVVEEKKQENHSTPKPQKYAKFKRKK